MNATPHVAPNLSGRRSAIDGRVTRQAHYAASPRIRKWIEQAFGWGKEIGTIRSTRFRGFVAAAYNLVRLPKLLAT